MTHRAEQILAAATTAVTGLTSTGAAVARGRLYPTDDSPALSVFMGADAVQGDYGYSNMAYVDRLLDLIIRIHAKGLTDDAAIDTLLNASRAEVFAAIATDPTLGLGFVISAYPAGDEAPVLDVSSDQPTGTQDMHFSVHYRHSTTSAEA